MIEEKFIDVIKRKTADAKQQKEVELSHHAAKVLAGILVEIEKAASAGNSQYLDNTGYPFDLADKLRQDLHSMGFMVNREILKDVLNTTSYAPMFPTLYSIKVTW